MTTLAQQRKQAFIRSFFEDDNPRARVLSHWLGKGRIDDIDDRIKVMAEGIGVPVSHEAQGPREPEVYNVDTGQQRSMYDAVNEGYQPEMPDAKYEWSSNSNPVAPQGTQEPPMQGMPVQGPTPQSAFPVSPVESGKMAAFSAAKLAARVGSREMPNKPDADNVSSFSGDINAGLRLNGRKRERSSAYSRADLPTNDDVSDMFGLFGEKSAKLRTGAYLLASGSLKTASTRSIKGARALLEK